MLQSDKLEFARQIWQKAPQPELAIYWYWLQTLVMVLPLSNIWTPFLGGTLLLLFLRQWGWRRLDTPVNRGWLGLAIWMVITTLSAYDISLAWTGLVNYLPFFLLFAIAAYLIQTPAQFRQIAWLIVLSSLCVSLMGIVQALLNQPTWTLPRQFNAYEVTLGFSPDRRISSLFGHYNEAAMYLVMVLPIACHFALGKVKQFGKSQQIVAAVALGLGLAVLILCGSRNAWALAIIGFLGLAIYYRYWWLVIGLIAGVGLFSWAVWGSTLGLGGEWLQSFLPKGLVNRLVSAIDPTRQDYLSTAYRLGAWQFAFELVKMHPLQGWGMRSFALIASVFNYDLKGLPHEHNFYLTLAVGAGLPALIMFVSLVTWIIGRGLQAKWLKATDGLMFAVIMAIALYFLSGFLDVLFYEPRVNMLSWLLLAMVYGVGRSHIHSKAAAAAGEVLGQDHTPLDGEDDSAKSA